jgi:hypothetical protein
MQSPAPDTGGAKLIFGVIVSPRRQQENDYCNSKT